MRPQRLAEMLRRAMHSELTVTPRERETLRRLFHERHYSVPLTGLVLARRILRRSGSVIATEEVGLEIKKACRARLVRVRWSMRGRLSLVPGPSRQGEAPPGPE